MLVTQSTATIKMLVVDDDKALLRLLAFHLEKAFAQRASIYTETEPLAAERLLNQERFDMLITDLDMVGKNGFHLLKTAKQKDPLLQVIILTAHRSANAILSALEIGADEFFVKAPDPRELAASVEYLLSRVERWRTTVPELAQPPRSIREDYTV